MVCCQCLLLLQGCYPQRRTPRTRAACSLPSPAPAAGTEHEDFAGYSLRFRIQGLGFRFTLKSLVRSVECLCLGLCWSSSLRNAYSCIDLVFLTRLRSHTVVPAGMLSTQTAMHTIHRFILQVLSGESMSPNAKLNTIFEIDFFRQHNQKHVFSKRQ